ncbi:B3/B4 domain-containing protein (DNA/RNA-binding domain of Phe-tRNA-synthetase) [Frankineae bacterium MT45]|nr:B3/B4 domain-containing protein (DNA/RNA-binding domain of Phe-tRNA-synthetase) [Frankineae bacterium MT45]
MSDDRATPPRTHAELTELLERATVHPDVVELRPDYRVLLIAVDGIRPAPSDEHSETLLRAAEDHARTVLEHQPVEQLPHVSAWRDAYRAFGAKPQRTRNSLEALLRRTTTGLPRVNRLTDMYNAISVTHSIPLGGEDLDHYTGPPRLLRATGTEPFLTTANGDTITEHPEVGEVVWADNAGVTCRRWNWRQTTRTQLRDTTTAALFILDALDPCTDDDLHYAANDLMTQLRAVSPDLVAAQRLIATDT